MANLKLTHRVNFMMAPSCTNLTARIKLIVHAEGSFIVSDSSGAPTLRSDARRNVDRIRSAAVQVFREQGFSAPLEDVAAAAEVSKATIFNRLGGRLGLIDAVIDEVVAVELRNVIEDARSVVDIRERICRYIVALRDLQYRLPAVNDVLLQEYRDSEPLLALCHAGTAFHDSLVAEGLAAGVLTADITPADFQALARDNALALKHGGRPPRADYDRRTAFVLKGICASSCASAS
ncbi:TetR/AcrR family transcriptional regulator [Brevibacterium sp. GP-SGM9]|uniref:TetR/AcrR family transcriptional regulator n=1 Tax=unclassified Brevibacterium TaxID=2614124 RepID=UPI001E49C22B|nr:MULTISPECIES: helix-turn-helix domain-containing protein [unclassified Brevibacterium]MDK8435889.1 helix-turn-helix domain-containing protein [Brevibacterium sp. H-BE7]